MKAYKVAKWHYEDSVLDKFESPLFATRELAEEFLSEIWGDDVETDHKWMACDWDDVVPHIQEIIIEEELPEIKKSSAYQETEYPQ